MESLESPNLLESSNLNVAYILTGVGTASGGGTMIKVLRIAIYICQLFSNFSSENAERMENYP